MSLFQALTGNSSLIDPLEHDPTLQEHLLEGEELGPGFKLLRDYVVFTDRRIILVNIQGVTGSKKSYRCYPYSKVVSYEVESKGLTDRDAEVRLYLMGMSMPIALQFSTNAMARDVGLLVGQQTLR